MSFRVLLFFALVILFPAGSMRAQTAAAGEAEVQKCEDRIGSVRRDVLAKYDDALGDLQLGLQKAADLEGALAVRAERQRAATEQSLSEVNFVIEPKLLRSLQVQTFARLQELVTQVVKDSVPKLLELKRALTVAGRLDEALAVRNSIERLQNANLPVVRPEPGSLVPLDTLAQAYAADRVRADKTYKGQRFIVRGVVAGYRVDPVDGKSYQIFLTSSVSGGWVQCHFAANEFRFREEPVSFGAVALVITSKQEPGLTARVQKGQALDVRGVCDGLDETVRLNKCELIK
jgi:tRNA_anti-like